MTVRQISARVLPTFPRRVINGIGIAWTKVAGIWHGDLDYASLGVTGAIADPANTYVSIIQPDGTYARVSTAVLAAGLVQPYTEETGKKNGFCNGGMHIWQRSQNDAAVSTTRKFVADRWGIKTGAGTLTSVIRAFASIPQRSPQTMAITGNAGVTTVDIDQRIEAGPTGLSGNESLLNYLRGPVTFSALIFNGTGSAFTPTLFVSTPTAQDNWAASNVRNGGGSGDALQSCPNGVYTRVFWGADISGYTNIVNGLEFRLRFPSGALDVNTKAIRFGEVQVEPRPTMDNIYTLFEVETFGDELLRCLRYYYKSFPYGTVPATNAGVATGPQAWAQIVGAAAAQAGGLNVRYPVVMRATPTVTTYNPAAANAQPRNETVGADCSAVAAVNSTDSGVVITCTTAAGSAAGNRMSVHITADAEL